MRGLLVKDLRLTLVRKQTLIMFAAMAIIMGVAMEGSFVVGYLTMLATIISMSTVTYDEYDNGYPFLLTLPFDKKTYVIEKYLFSFIAEIVAWFFGVVMYVIVNIAVRNITVNITEEIVPLLIIIPLMYLAAIVMIPTQLKFGSERSRIVLFVVFGGLAAAVFLAEKLYEQSNTVFLKVVELVGNTTPAAALCIATAAGVILAVVSCMCSIFIMEKKEF